MAAGYFAEVDPARCDRKPVCPVSRNCPVGAVQYLNGAVTIDREKCTGCGRCERVCPRQAVRLIPRG